MTVTILSGRFQGLRTSDALDAAGDIGTAPSIGRRVVRPSSLNPDFPDSGCEVAPRCLECPRAQCKYDDPDDPELAVRNAQIEAARAAGESAVQVAARFGISVRSVYRAITMVREERAG